MKQRYNQKTMIILTIIGVLLLFIASQVLFLRFNGKSVPVPSIPRDPQVQGEGEPLTYVVMGDSITVGQGGTYENGVAQSTARSLAENRQVTMYNTGQSGADVRDVLVDQLPKALEYKPDVVLIVAGSNDVTHRTSLGSIESSVQDIVAQLIASNCDTKIVLTGSAAMGTVPRIPQPLRWLAGQRAKDINVVFKRIIDENQLTFAAVADKTGSQFASDRSLIAPDKFHPNDKGYELWSQVLSESLNEALASQPSHCQS